MKINLVNNNIIEMENLDEKIKSWFEMNEEFISNMITKFIRDYGWAFGGASELHLDIKELYNEHPYNLAEKYGAIYAPYYLMAA